MDEEQVPGGNGWNEWRRHVLAELKRLNGAIEHLYTEIKTEMKLMQERQSKTDAEIALLKSKLALIGTVTGLFAGGIISLIVALIT